MIIKETLNKGALSGGQTKKNHQNVIKRVIHGYCHDAWLADFSYPWNVNLGNYSSWLVTWMFCVTREELGLFTDIRACTTLFWVIFETVFQMVRVLYREWLRYTICNMEPWLSEFVFFKHSIWRQNTFFPEGVGVLPHMGYVGMPGLKGCVFSGVLVINRVSILVDFGHFDHK